MEAISIMERVAERNSSVNFNENNDSHFIIDPTGMKEVYYTLYFFSKAVAKFGKSNPYIYKQNLSHDFDEAVDKFLNGWNGPVVVMDCGELNARKKAYAKGSIKFGKYAGRQISEVFDEDRNYCMWLRDTLDKTYYSNNKSKQDILEQLNSLIDAYFESLKYENSINVKSEYIDEPKVTNLTAEVIKLEVNDEYTRIRAKNDNKYFLIYIKDIDTTGIVGKTIYLKSGRVNHKEICGIKYNYLNYVKGLEVR